jgi:HK97 family phage portal protein
LPSGLRGLFSTAAKGLAEQARSLVNTGTYGGGVSWAQYWNDTASGGLSGRSQVKDSAVGYRCVETIASNGASLSLMAVSPEGERVDHPFLDLWNKQPNPMTSARTMSQTLWWRLETRGEWFAYLDRGPTGTGEPEAIWPLIGMGVDLIVDGTADRPWDSTLVGFAVEKDGLRRTLLPSEVLWVHYPDPDDPWAPLPPLRAALPALGLDATAVAFQTSQFRNADRPSGVLYLGDVDREDHEKVEASIRARHEGSANAGRTLVLSGPVPSKYERFGLTTDEVGYLSTRAVNADEVMLAFGIPKDYLMGGATYENRSASRQTLWSDTILPKCDVVASELDRQVFPQVDLTATFDVTRVSALQE